MSGNQPWDDERLDAAWAARSDRAATPADLPDAVMAQLRSPQNRRSTPTWRVLLPIAAVVALAFVWIRPPWLVGPADPGGSPDPNDLHGLTLMTVSEAIAIRDAGGDDRALAVSGWVSPISSTECPAPATDPSSPLEPRCPDAFRWVTEAPERLLTVTPDFATMVPPTGPAISPDFAAVAQSWLPSEVADGQGVPVPVVLIGHFDDRRASFCPPDVLRDCEDRFVVDQVVSADGASVSAIAGVDVAMLEVPDVNPAADLVDRAVPAGITLSALALGRGQIAGVEPSLAYRRGGIVQARLVWRFQVLEAEHVRTYLVEEFSHEVIAVADDGPTLSIAPTPSQTHPTPSPATLAGSLPVVTVAELLDRSGSEPSAEEVVVRGWILFTREAYDCLQNPDPHPLIPYCQGEDYLTDGPIDVLDDPIPNAIVPILAPDAHIEVRRHGAPIEVLAVGHQRDHRWTTCPTEQQAACKARFVIDRLLPIDAIADAPLAPWSIVEGDSDHTMQLTPDDVAARVEAVVGPARVISIGSVSPSRARDIEPGVFRDPANTDPVYRTYVMRPYWIVRALTDDSAGSLRTFLVLDAEQAPGQSNVAEITETGVVALLGDGIRRFVVELALGTSIAPESSSVTVTDKSGHLLAASAPDQAVVGSVGSAPGERTVWLIRDTAISGRAYVGWEGGMCDRPAMTIDAAATRIEVGHDPAPGGCRMAGITRVVQLDFDDPAVVDRLASSLESLAPTPAPSGIGHPFSATIDLLSLEGPTLPLKLLDETGALIEARSASVVELDYFEGPMPEGAVRIENLLPNADSTIIVLWDTTCDTSLTMILSSREGDGRQDGDPPSSPTDLELDAGIRACSSDPIRHGVVLRYALEVLAENITVTRRTYVED